MPDLAANMVEPVGGFDIQGRMMRYNLFMPRLYNWCKSLGFEPGKIMPSRAFCSDESQGYPIIMIAKHFGVFPFNHGVVGGIVATDRHGPHASHGQDMLIIQASHVGYDPVNSVFGTYRRPQTTHNECSSSCGKIQNVIDWYRNEYDFARHNILLHNDEGEPIVIVDNQLLREDRDEGLFLHLDKLIARDASNQRAALRILSTAKVFVTNMGADDSPEAMLEALGHAEGFLRAELAGLGLRRLPHLVFAQDKAFESGERVLAILDQLSHTEASASEASGVPVDAADDDGEGQPDGG
jgi:hypothetical protein